jgi:ADP-L-glycero-D-manno-heptose 6-epimerase
MILITGHEGFIGKRFYNHCLNSKIPVRGFEWRDTLNLDDIKTVIHLGGISSTTETNVDKIMTQNYDFSVFLLEECIRRDINFQYSSSASVYGKNSTFMEISPVDPRTPYAWSKYMFERYAQRKKEKITIQGFRYFNVWAETGEERKGNQASPYHKFTQEAKNTGTITLFENSEECKRDFIHVDEIINYHLKFLDVKESGVWNLGTGKPKSFLDVANEVSSKYPCTYKYIAMPENLIGSYQYYTCADMRKTEQTLRNISLS